jgi:hypothetical protein
MKVTIEWLATVFGAPTAAVLLYFVPKIGLEPMARWEFPAIILVIVASLLGACLGKLKPGGRKNAHKLWAVGVSAAVVLLCAALYYYFTSDPQTPDTVEWYSKVCYGVFTVYYFAFGFFILNACKILPPTSRQPAKKGGEK